jgi:hypothetical protein
MKRIATTLALVSLSMACSSREQGSSSQINSISTDYVGCASVDGRRSVCNVNGRILKASLYNQSSNSPCTQGTSWGADETYIWVDKGCRATFRVDVASSTSRTIISCYSQDGRRSSCRAPGRILSADLGSVYSQSPCTEGTSWGFNKDIDWLDQGCRASFEVEDAE